jgi:hypothetical protein
MKKYLFIIAAALMSITLASNLAWAINMPMSADGNTGCKPIENATVVVTFEGYEKDAGVAKSTLDAKFEEVKSLAAMQNFEKYYVQSNNYSINAGHQRHLRMDENSAPSEFRYHGVISFSILPADKAAQFMAVLSQKGYQANINVSSYRDNSCSQSGLPPLAQ